MQMQDCSPQRPALGRTPGRETVSSPPGVHAPGRKGTSPPLSLFQRFRIPYTRHVIAYLSHRSVRHARFRQVVDVFQPWRLIYAPITRCVGVSSVKQSHRCGFHRYQSATAAATDPQQQQLPIRNSSSNRSATATATNPQQQYATVTATNPQRPHQTIRNSNSNPSATATATNTQQQRRAICNSEQSATAQ